MPLFNQVVDAVVIFVFQSFVPVAHALFRKFPHGQWFVLAELGTWYPFPDAFAIWPDSEWPCHLSSNDCCSTTEVVTETFCYT